MSKRAFLAATAIIAGSFNPVLTTTAWAAVIVDTPAASGPTAATLTAMQTQCDALAAAHGTAWTGELDEGSITPTLVSGPTEVGTHTYAANGVGDQEGAGTYTPAHLEFTSDPYRNGGSVNMWANADSVGGYYSASEYDFENEFETTYSYAFDCSMSEHVVYPAEGMYVIDPALIGTPQANAALQACNAFNEAHANGANQGFWGNSPQGNCVFEGTQAHEEDEDRPSEAGIPIEETQTDTLLAHEDNGEGFFDSETVSIGKVLVCISPTTSTQTKKGAPGTWTTKHGYDGGSLTGPAAGCNTLWYNSGATLGVTNLNTGSNNVVTVPVVLP